MEIVFVQLSHEARKIAVLEMFRQDCLGKFLTLEISSVESDPGADRPSPQGLTHLQDHEAIPFITPAYD